MSSKISKTKQIENFKEYLRGKTPDQIFQLRLDHETIHHDNNGKRTKAQMAKNVKLPVFTVSLLLETPLKIWDSIMDIVRYWDWIERAFGESVKMSVIRKNPEICPWGTSTYEPEIEESDPPYRSSDYKPISRCRVPKGKKQPLLEMACTDWHRWVYGDCRNPIHELDN